MAPIHPTRMPVMLTCEADFSTWLSGAPEQAHDLARPYPAEGMHIVARGEKADPA